MDNRSLAQIDQISGVNNVDPEFRIPIVYRNGVATADVVTLENLDIDNTLSVSMRPGCVKKLSGTDVHSWWTDGKTGLYVDGSVLYRMDQGYARHELLTGLLAGSRMSYAKVNDRVYMTNGQFIGYFRDTVTALTDPSVQFKAPLPAGQRIAYYRGRLYVAKGPVLYISDALCDHYDIRTGFRVFEADITMIIAVDKGLYIADGKTWFVSGDDPDGFRRDAVFDVDAIPWTERLIDGSKIGDGMEGNLAIWTSSLGVCLGDNAGQVKNLTGHRYADQSQHSTGGAMIRELNGKVHYISTLM